MTYKLSYSQADFNRLEIAFHLSLKRRARKLEESRRAAARAVGVYLDYNGELTPVESRPNAIRLFTFDTKLKLWHGHPTLMADHRFAIFLEHLERRFKLMDT